MNNQFLNLEKRLERIVDVLAAAAANDYSAQIDIGTGNNDELTTVEIGINLLVRDLSGAVNEIQALREELGNKL